MKFKVGSRSALERAAILEDAARKVAEASSVHAAVRTLHEMAAELSGKNELVLEVTERKRRELRNTLVKAGNRYAIAHAAPQNRRAMGQGRRRIVEAARAGLDLGMEKQEIAKLAGISRPTLNEWLGQEGTA